MTTEATGRAHSIKRPQLPISTLVLLFAALLIVLASSALLFIGYVATNSADRQAALNAARLFDNALHEKQMLIARDQQSLARWDRTVANVVLAFDKVYVRDEMVDSLWHDYGHDRTFFIAPDGRLLAEATRSEVDFSGGGTIGPDIKRIVAQATALHYTHRIAIAGGYGQKTVPHGRIERIAALGFARIDGQPALVSATAIVPDDGTVALPDGPPTILVSAKFIDAGLLSDLNDQLAFTDLTFAASPFPANHGHRALTSLDGTPLGGFLWKSVAPGAHIWKLVIPFVAAIAGLLALSAFVVARKIGRLTHRLEESEAENHRLARSDTLTGLANRLRFEAELSARVAALPEPFAVMACDLDRFKAVNDTYGHAAGDIVIRTIADRLRETIGSAGMVARVGGDEFVILISSYTDRPRLGVLAQQILSSAAAPIAVDVATTDVGISLGIAMAPENGSATDTIMASADAALYQAKQAGRGMAIFANSKTGGVETDAAADTIPSMAEPKAEYGLARPA